jgi:Pregnancy-associated plasma protein-A
VAAEDIPQSRLCGAMPATVRQLELNPEFGRAQQDLEDATSARLATGVIARRGLLEIPVIVNVVSKTDEQNISDGQIQSQIDVLNKDFRAENSDLHKIPEVWRSLATDAQLEFRLAEVTRTRTDRDFFSDNDDVKFTSEGGHDVIDPQVNLNIWVCNLRPWLGYAYFPGTVPAERDGVVIGHRWFGTEGTATDPYNLGRTATHEIGHYLNLYHIWGRGPSSCDDSDFVEDTPNQLESNGGKPNFPQISCNNGPFGDMFMNYMDYTDDDSMFMFTAQQVVRMRTALAESRPNLGQ